jgi:hypothetical protein
MFSKVMKKMLALTLTLALVCSLTITTVNAEGGTNAQLRDGMLSLISDYDDDATGEIASVSVENANADDVSVTMNVWTLSVSCNDVLADATMILKNISEDGLTVKFDFDLKGYYKKVEIGDVSFTADGTAEISLGVDEEITIVLYSDNVTEDDDVEEWGKATLILSNFVLTPFHICSADSHVMGEEPSCFYDGWKDYYMCRCEETFYADEDGTQQITDLEAWKQGDGKLTASHNYGELIEQNDGTHTADTLENGMKAHYFCDVCETYFTEEKAATTKDDLVIEVGHDYTVENGYIGDDGHANTCECGARGTLYDHTPDIPAPTETEDQKCFVCDHILEPATGHLCVNHLTKVGEKPADCDEDGNTEYYECSCGKYFEDETATVEITDKESVIIPSGHSHGKEWKRDDTNHWNECACGDKANTAPHADENNDEKCDACGFEMKTPEAENPETSDVNIMFVIIMMIAALGIFTVVRKRRYTA